MKKWIIKDDDKYFFYKDCYNKFKEWLERYSLLLENTTKEFVTKNFPGVKDISFHNKNNGNQIGTICHMHFEDGSFKKLYVKTHQFGPTASMSKSRKSPDVKELLVYKILENIGLGPKSYFFWPENVSVKTLFIATEGLDLTFYNPNHPTVPTEEEKLELLKLDFISRILYIVDSTTNSGNYGYCKQENKAYIIDFGTEEEDYYSSELLDDFYKGNGRYNYKGVMKQVVSVSKVTKDNLAKSIIADLGLERNIIKSKDFILHLISNSGPVRINSKKLLEKYTLGVIETVKFIKGSLQI
ncbi:hypothetical protein BC833DRAFT_608176 [Globomyces pollinis-pini]|nr:hypothetical protein BC833DRAFT_608176 [Globomyces pollinis-pini]